MGSDSLPSWLLCCEQPGFAAQLTPARVARSLARICRFGGQCPHWYSVATHSVLVMTLVRDVWRRTDEPIPLNAWRLALMHDAHEMFTGDICRPIVQQLPSVKTVQRRLDFQIFNWFEVDGFESEAAAAVELADNKALELELEYLGQTTEDIAQQLPDAQPLTVNLLSLRGSLDTDAALWLRYWNDLKQSLPVDSE